jgi:YebC/PmpR family DNA-binding regulatory protein
MSGHSKWATTKHKKAINDSRRAKLFAKLIKNIEVASRLGGPDPDGNPTLYDAIQKARKNSLPNDNIERAVKRGAGQLGDSVDYSSITYEGYAPGGIALLIECLTDNRNRAAAEVRLAVTRSGGAMADPGSVSYLFSRKGVISGAASGVTEDALLAATLEFAVDEIELGSDYYVITTSPSDLVSVRQALQSAGIDYESAEVEQVPEVRVPASAEAVASIEKIIDALEDLDDVQNVYANYESLAQEVG